MTEKLQQQYPPAPVSHFGGIQDTSPVGGVQGVESAYNPLPPDAPAKDASIRISRKTLFIIIAVVLLCIGGLVGGLVGGLRSRNNSGGSSQSTPSASQSPIGIEPTTASTPTSSTPAPISTSDTPYSWAGYASTTVLVGENAATATPSPFPGYDEPLARGNLVSNGNFAAVTLDKFDNWSDDDKCWQDFADPSPSTPLQENLTNSMAIARTYNEGTLPTCNLTQVITGVGAGKFQLTFLYGSYENETLRDNWFFVSAGGASSPQLILATQEPPDGVRYYAWSRGAYEIDSEEDDFSITFSGHSANTVWDVAQVQLVKL
ncbi:hypothetical protein ABW19_dt0205413 [Dactylella cylindrospora]|nr:hypothetical protein ABW19_dt0205413 [Dactylella cylindrospora]